nr:25s rrna (adenine(2142)-n(1))-methyltransferase [Quercus suber]
MAITRKPIKKKPSKAKLGSLKTGRTPFAPNPKPSIPSKATNAIINTHHTLNKRLIKAQTDGNIVEAAEISKAIEQNGGLEAYQQASLQGQAGDRGGDSSLVLMQWLKPLAKGMDQKKVKLRMLETKNACSKSGLFDITRIDLFSQDAGITQQDFMQRALPAKPTEKFDLISLSLVLNFVPDASGRGEMLRRTTAFLDRRATAEMNKQMQAFYPALFLVLPAPCVLNSRYVNEERLTLLMASLGYVMLERKNTAKLLYYLWQWRDAPLPEEQKFGKREINPGGGRNNFSIVLR